MNRFSCGFRAENEQKGMQRLEPPAAKRQTSLQNSPTLPATHNHVPEVREVANAPGESSGQDVPRRALPHRAAPVRLAREHDRLIQDRDVRGNAHRVADRETLLRIQHRGGCREITPPAGSKMPNVIAFASSFGWRVLVTV